MYEVGAAFVNEGLIDDMAQNNGHTKITDEDRAEARDKLIAVHLMRGSNKHHQAYLQELQNQFLN